MIPAFLLLLGCQLAGELLARTAGVPVPGPVLGMVLLFGVLLARGSLAERVQPVSQGLLRALPLLFVPAGAGLMQHFARFRSEAVAIAAAVLVSTLLAIAVSAWVFQAVARRR